MKMDGGYVDLRSYTDGLRNSDSCFDIVAVYNDVKYTTNIGSNIGYSIASWRMSKEPSWKREILYDKEKEYLSQIIKPFRDDVCSIEKNINSNSTQFITITVKSVYGYNSIHLPDFAYKTMYQGMKEECKYTVEELGL